MKMEKICAKWVDRSSGLKGPSFEPPPRVVSAKTIRDEKETIAELNRDSLFGGNGKKVSKVSLPKFSWDKK